MVEKDNTALREASPYSGVLTREQFLFYETRTVARLVCEGLDRDAIVAKIVDENLFQYPTEKSIRKMAFTCLHRLDAMEDSSLVEAIASQPSDVAKQICLYAMMCQYRLMWDFMITVIGEKYRLLDMSFGKIDLNSFFDRLQEQDNWVASWSDSTITRKYLDNYKADHLNPVLINPLLENAIREAGKDQALVAFNCMA